MTDPSVVGLPVDDARQRLSDQGLAVVEEVATRPPRGTPPGWVLRVVRQDAMSANAVRLIVAHFPCPGDDAANASS